MHRSIPHHTSAQRRATSVALLGIAALLTGACTSNGDDAAGRRIAVSSSDDGCDVAETSVPAGTLIFEVTNDGSSSTEFYVFAADGVAIVGEVENIGPGISRDMVVQASAGEYVTACKPGMTGDGIRAPFTVVDDGGAGTGEGAEADPEFAALLTTATDDYHRFVRDEIEQLVVRTDEFAQLYVDGDHDAARALYPEARMHWERIEPVAESFGDLDPRLDLREADLEPGQAWTGWHAIEKDLWPPDDHTTASAGERSALADGLVADTADLSGRVQALTYDPAQLGNGAKELLDEVATGKVTGEEEIWSGTDLWDFQANVDGARTAFVALRPALEQKDPALATTLTERFDAVQALLDDHRVDDGFRRYGDLTTDQVRELAAAVDALGEPLAGLTAAVVL